MPQTFLPKLTALTQTISHSSIVRFTQRRKRLLASLIILAFFVFIGYYLFTHLQVIQNILHIGYANTVSIVGGYTAVLLTNVGIMYATIRLCQKKLPLKSGALLMIYSSVINFFGPLQSGPGVRAVYLKAKTGLRIRDFTAAMVFYYFAFAAINASLLFVNNLPWFSLLSLGLSAALLVAATRKFTASSLRPFVWYIVGLTLVQIMFMVSIYATELGATDPTAHYSLTQITSFTASANLSLFVSLTPGAIGIREAFLIFSQSLHHIPLSAIVAVGIVDRAIYVVFLALLFVLSSSLHLRDMFIGKQQL